MRDGNRKFNSGSSMTAQTLADLSGAPVENVRYYTRRGLLKPARHPRNRYNLYRESDVARLQFISRAKNLGYTLKEIARIFAESGRGASPCPLAREIIERRIADNRKRLEKCSNCKPEWRRRWGAGRICPTKRRTDIRSVI